MSFKDNTKKDSFLILFIIYILHLIFMIFVNNKISIIDSQIFKYVYTCLEYTDGYLVFQ